MQHPINHNDASFTRYLHVSFYRMSLFLSETIWSATVSVCTQVQEMTTTQGQQLLRELQWRQIYGSDALFNVLAHIVDYFNNQAAA